MMLAYAIGVLCVLANLVILSAVLLSAANDHINREEGR